MKGSRRRTGGNQLLMDSTVCLQEIEARITARVFAAVHHPERGPAVRAVLEQLLGRFGCFFIFSFLACFPF